MNPPPAPKTAPAELSTFAAVDRIRMLKAFVDAPDLSEPADAMRYVKASLRCFLQDAGRTKMEQAFALQAAPRTRSAARTAAEHAYGQALLNAWQSLPGLKPGVGKRFPWAEVERFLAEIKEFEMLCWPQWQKSGLPKRASAMQAHLYLACELAMTFRAEAIKKKGLHPRTAKGLYELLTRVDPLT